MSSNMHASRQAHQQHMTQRKGTQKCPELLAKQGTHQMTTLYQMNAIHLVRLHSYSNSYIQSYIYLFINSICSLCCQYNASQLNVYHTMPIMYCNAPNLTVNMTMPTQCITNTINFTIHMHLQVPK